MDLNKTSQAKTNHQCDEQWKRTGCRLSPLCEHNANLESRFNKRIISATVFSFGDSIPHLLSGLWRPNVCARLKKWSAKHTESEINVAVRKYYTANEPVP